MWCSLCHHDKCEAKRNLVPEYSFPLFFPNNFLQRFAADDATVGPCSTFRNEIFQTCWWVKMSLVQPGAFINLVFCCGIQAKHFFMGCLNVVLILSCFVSHGHFRGRSFYTFQPWLSLLLICSALLQWSASIVVFEHHRPPSHPTHDFW